MAVSSRHEFTTFAAKSYAIMAKSLLFDQEGRRKLSKGIDKIAKAVGSTLGPSGQTVLIESPQHTHGITVATHIVMVDGPHAL